MPQSSPYERDLHHSHSTTSVAASVTTYHSFNDVELYEHTPRQGPVRVELPLAKDNAFQPALMQRRDSGYESTPPGSKSGGSHRSGRRTSTTSNSSSHMRPRTRPSIRRAARSTPSPRPSVVNGHSLQRPRSQQQSFAYFQFPSPEASLREDKATCKVEPTYPPPPQTTHYWTSDHSRKLEYAAIDAASQGIKGWILKHVVPDCFVPKENRRLTFDDDTGSVRRYRLELEGDAEAEEEADKSRKMGWLLGR
ncbi:hypothetical protein BJ170DRAFT_593465 [Xylariales sp. AK1849]|nr:hypothetical protein BJ170DRAFT_593465 [Xylariales sp. AK1849]